MRLSYGVGPYLHFCSVDILPNVYSFFRFLLLLSLLLGAQPPFVC